MLQQPSRHFDAYGAMSGNMFSPDDQPLRYETSRFDRMNGQLPSMGYGYDPQQAQTWNPNAFSTNNSFAPYGAATGRLKSQTRGRSAIPNVSCTAIFLGYVILSLTMYIAELDGPIPNASS